ncbi:hypothetical protein HWQ46_26800 [Shewanella sp. D64]|uniref:hypothetical protein n=1 Tax=unclassified Shewanella TaxID=196818 RepID=UPI0022BA43B4|nr:MULTISPECIES: hypothetical protein [unclassified Shewanella]MEC4729117.1 hypothetical protein [Shewanella sp. D64]MEC4740926.1 hypothetical protein [Shewanella sp. E94]WBJ93548.1 hypothetical protein HWQ47_16630 [Shewanella sp. MTB7]
MNNLIKSEAVYCGFSVSEMLNGLNRESNSVVLTKVENEEWHLYVMSDLHGEFESTGPLGYVLMKASKPHRKKWKSERKQLIKGWQVLMSRTCLNE